MRHFIVALAVAFALVAGASAAHAKQVRFVGMHPVPKASGGGFCYIEVPHVHGYQPGKGRNFRHEHDQYHFVGDPVAHGYDGPKHSYYGHHPMQYSPEMGGAPHTEYCYLDGPHYHYFAPSPSLNFTVRGGVHFYAGEYPAEYEQHRPELVQINATYRPMRYERPVYVDAPPVEYRGPVFVVEPVVVEPVVVAPAPVYVEPVVSAGVEVHLPLPSLHVEIGAPAVVVGAPVHHHHGVVVVERDHRHHRVWKRHHHGRGRGHWKKH